MGLFSKKKKKEESKSLPLPEFPKLSDVDDLKFPSYEPNLETKHIKSVVDSESQRVPKEIAVPKRDFAIPVRKPLPKPILKETVRASKKDYYGGGASRQNPVYVRMGDYKKSLESIEMIKDKLEEAEYSFAKLDKIKQDENNELAIWQDKLNKIKEELHSIDNRLFKGV